MEIDFIHAISWKRLWKYVEVCNVSHYSGSWIFDYSHQLQLPRPYSVGASMSFHLPQYASTYFQEYHKRPAFSIHFPYESTELHSIYLHGNSYQFQWKYTQVNWKWREIDLLPWKQNWSRFTYMEVDRIDLLPWKLVEACPSTSIHPLS